MTDQLHEITETFGERIVFAVVGLVGAVHFWCQPDTGSDPDYTHFGGVEVHYGFKPSWGRDEPENECCWLLKRPCWHDGSSLQATERYIPVWKVCKQTGEYDAIFAMLRSHYRYLEEQYAESIVAEKQS